MSEILIIGGGPAGLSAARELKAPTVSRSSSARTKLAGSRAIAITRVTGFAISNAL